MLLIIILISFIAIYLLAYFRTPIWLWAALALLIGVAGVLFSGGQGWFSWSLALLPAVVLALFSVPVLRRAILIRPIYNTVKRTLPKISSTEQEALDAGTVGWDADLFSGRPKWVNLLSIPKGEISEEEQAFIDGPTNQLCAMIDDWDIRHNRADMPEEVWQFMKDNGFFGMLISKENGGKGFSAQAQSKIVSMVASRSIAAGITVMVPNSLGPGELLEKYGTPAQQKKYLARLATGKEIPCFALTGVHAGSDAAGMRDVGVVGYGQYKGKKVLGVTLSWDKRYITLSPVATLVGLAFNLYDPENLLGKGENVGITLALVPADYEGVELGLRHYPARSAFLNGPTSGKDVFVPIEFLIGEKEYAGQGWRMLMECLSTGRAISLPAIGSVSMKAALRVTSAYARIRRQFSIPIGMMEGVAAPLARLVKSSYMFEGARTTTAAMVDQGQKPAVISALLKYRATEAMRDRLDDAMDIHGGRGIQDGPGNYLFASYATTPVAITVEGANILTRSLITFAQGSLRAHPHLYDEITAVQNPDRRAGLKAFDKAFCGHVSFMLGNITGSLFHSLTFGRFASSPVDHELAYWYKQLHRYSQNFALVGDWMVAFLGGDLKRKQRLSGRMADILSDLYLLSTTLKRYEDDGRIKEDLPVIEAIARDRVAAIEANFREVFNNFPSPVMSFFMRVLVFPLGQHALGATDKENYSLARAILVPNEQRDRFTRGVYINDDPKDVTGVLEDALAKVVRVEEIEAKFIRALKKGLIQRRMDRDAITDAVTAEILTNEEAGFLRIADEATDKVIAVDNFAPGELEAHHRVADKQASQAAQ
ncbi:Butyryl-CoA dehydrogenase [hydrothermal vent metagenome]|uniref:Acyl-coenzyme A dehydrogenase n=1 Tax=hydrothermal vent metagenome TaxID=652676 RepID=A0A3B0UIN1_9ZZZZ